MFWKFPQRIWILKDLKNDTASNEIEVPKERYILLVKKDNKLLVN